ncbi:hypothetical protein Bpfe_025095 [Biomphalaria pfeifferi]|uniref:Uncharacterized protein n=1 Tax=Biomphalaria pfeifferi TaxID=112525 RepID=A0AAD8B177_BIOPF|nr:hypothetical protein Bpfe_025095 [Biomphalaria pfeifferi]
MLPAVSGDCHQVCPRVPSHNHCLISKRRHRLANASPTRKRPPVWRCALPLETTLDRESFRARCCEVEIVKIVYSERSS